MQKINNIIKYINILVLNFKIAIAILFSNILSFIPFYLLGVYGYCFFDLLSLLHITVTSLDSELVKNFFIDIYQYIIQNCIQDIYFDIVEIFLSIIQLMLLFIYLVIDQYTLKDTSIDTPHNINEMQNQEIKPIISLMEKKGEGGQGELDDPVFSKTNKGKYKASPIDDDLEQDPALSKTDKGKYKASVTEQDLEEEDEDEDGYYSIYSPSEYSLVDTNTINSDDDEEMVEKKLALQELDRKLQQEARDREIAIKLQEDLSLNEKVDTRDILSKVEKVSTDLNKEIERLNSYFPSETGEASSSKTTTEQSTRSKQSQKHKQQQESYSDYTDKKKTKKR